MLGTGLLENEATAAPAPAVAGPGAVPITLTSTENPQGNGGAPRDAGRRSAQLPGHDGRQARLRPRHLRRLYGHHERQAVYSCTVLAIDAQGKDIETIEGLATGNNMHPVSKAFVDNDAQQCGYCTPGFVMACKGFLDEHPNPTEADVNHGLGGNLCRCGTYVGIRKAVLQAAKEMKGGKRMANTPTIAGRRWKSGR